MIVICIIQLHITMPRQITIYNTSIIEEYKCESCKIKKPRVFFSSTNGKMNGTCKKCSSKCKNCRQ